MNNQNKVVLVAVLTFMSVVTLPVCCDAVAQHAHRAELLRVDKELKAECIAILLRNVPRVSWANYAEVERLDHSTCQRAMMLAPGALPMKGDNWLDRLDVGRTTMERDP